MDQVSDQTLALRPAQCDLAAGTSDGTTKTATQKPQTVHTCYVLPSEKMDVCHTGSAKLSCESQLPRALVHQFVKEQEMGCALISIQKTFADRTELPQLIEIGHEIHGRTGSRACPREASNHTFARKNGNTTLKLPT